jgi:hypothetical protein
MRTLPSLSKSRYFVRFFTDRNGVSLIKLVGDEPDILALSEPNASFSGPHLYAAVREKVYLTFALPLVDCRLNFFRMARCFAAVWCETRIQARRFASAGNRKLAR